jgi:hypothetical protein
MEFKGTKGEWKANHKEQFYNGSKDTYEINYGNDGECIAEVVHGLPNAKVMAASKDLLEALQFIKKEYEELVDCGDCGNWNPRTDNCIVQAKKAIDKALN